MRPWLDTTYLDLKREHLRRGGRRPALPLQLDDADVPIAEPGALLGAERRHRVRQAVGQLPTSQREVVERHWLEGRPCAEVAERAGVSVGAARVGAHRGYRQLRARPVAT